MFGLWGKLRKADGPSAASGPDAKAAAKVLPALAAADFVGVRHFASIWDDSAHHVADLNGALGNELADALFACGEPQSPSPLGRIVVGQAGAGKTHLLHAIGHELAAATGGATTAAVIGAQQFVDGLIAAIQDGTETDPIVIRISPEALSSAA